MKIAVHPMDSAGHLNPLLALCMKLRDQGRHEISFFLATDVYQTELSQLGFQTHLVGEKGEGHTQQSMLEGIPSYEEQDETDSKFLKASMIQRNRILTLFMYFRISQQQS